MKGCRSLTADEMARVSQSFRGPYSARDQALFVVGIKTGFRISELLSLRVGEIWQHGQFLKRVAVLRRYVKGKIEGRSVILHAEAKTALAPWLMEMNCQRDVSADTYLLASRKGINRPPRPGQARHLLRQAYAACRLIGKVSTHTMRKTFGQNFYEKSSRDLLKTQRAMGHKSPASTVAYLHIDEREIDDLILAL